MEQQSGRLKAWKDEKGFGFIRPDNGGKDVFVHIRDFGQISRPPRIGDVIRYQPMKDREGRLRAGDVQISGITRSAAPSKKSKDNHKASRRKPQNRSISLGVSVIIISLLGVIGFNLFKTIITPSFIVSEEISASDSIIQQAYKKRQSNLQVTGTGKVVRILPDDLEGSRHQKFILRLASGQTLLISHNIDLAPRIKALEEGDKVSFNGEYEWNGKGGVVHWTHHDPADKHEDGWLEHEGRKYQ